MYNIMCSIHLMPKEKEKKKKKEKKTGQQANSIMQPKGFENL